MLDDALTNPPMMAAIRIMGSGRLGPTITALVGLTAAFYGARSLARAKRPRERTRPEDRVPRPTALLLGLLAVLLGGLFLVTADGGPGTGNGVVGSAAAIVLGCVAVALDRFTAMQRGARRPTSSSSQEQ